MTKSELLLILSEHEYVMQACDRLVRRRLGPDWWCRCADTSLDVVKIHANREAMGEIDTDIITVGAEEILGVYHDQG